MLSNCVVRYVLNENKLKETDNLWKEFQSPEGANEILKEVAFKKFKDTTEALQATCSLADGKIGKALRKLLKKWVLPEVQETLAVADTKLAAIIKVRA
ncbi:unnamed protein product [Soboliphyme baturini]|uniref:NOP5NT domain-containing protein n=1 Tax=Soboliphyme baturini TaxID=241478 RepID=A0A183IC46_9BILA|nr:unnamed protein product [Soboliphyme baturini]